MPTNQRLAILFVALVMLAAIGRSWWLYMEARAIAESWLREHKYRVRSLKVGLFPLFRFPARFFRNEERSTPFRAVVDDQQLGGTGVVWLRVWTDRLGLIAREPDVSWERRPVKVDPGDVPPEEKWELVQRALLKRVAHGETSFAAPRHPKADEMPFDEVVEHLLAMQKRGLIACSLPRASRQPGSRYDFIEFVEITDTGRAYFEQYG